jgi:hypothetical protein
VAEDDMPAGWEEIDNFQINSAGHMVCQKRRGQGFSRVDSVVVDSKNIINLNNDKDSDKAADTVVMGAAGMEQYEDDALPDRQGIGGGLPCRAQEEDSFTTAPRAGELTDTTRADPAEYSRGTNRDLIQVTVGVRAGEGTTPVAIRALVDTGCVPTGVSASFVERMGLQSSVQGPPLWLRTITGQIVQISETVELPMVYSGQWNAPTAPAYNFNEEDRVWIQVTTRAYVMPNLPADIVLGIHYMRQRGWKHNLEGDACSFRVQTPRARRFHVPMLRPTGKIPNMAMMALTEVQTGAVKRVIEEKVQLELDSLLEEGKACEGPRPAFFPAELWPYVLAEHRPAARERWAKYTEPMVDAFTSAFEKIYIEVGDEEREAEEPFFRAQVWANADIFHARTPRDGSEFFIPGEQFEINMKPGSTVVGYQKRWSQVEKCYLRHRIPSLVAAGKVRASTSSFNNPVLLVVKDGPRMKRFFAEHGAMGLTMMELPEWAAEVMTWYRLVGDFRELNEATVPEPYPLPIIEEILDQVPYGTDRFSCTDLPDAFFQIRIRPGDEYKTAFRTPQGVFEYVGTPQGTRNAAMKLAAVVARLFENPHRHKRDTFQDDLFCYEQRLRQHLEVLEEMYDIARTNNLELKPTKTMLNCRRMRVLGHILSGDGRQPDPKSLESILLIQPPKNLTDVRSICGLANVTKNYVHLLTRILEPIQDLQKLKTAKLIQEAWSPTHQEALTALKVALTSAPILLPPDMSQPFTVKTDACKLGRGLGAILCQKHPETGEDHPVQYWSKALAKSERRYSATDLECKCIHDAVRHWGHYLRNNMEFTVVTDHYALVYMLVKATKSRNGRLEGYIRYLQDYYFGVTHRAGLKHLDADAISRLFQYGDERVQADVDEQWLDGHLVTDTELQGLGQCLGLDATLCPEKFQSAFDYLAALVKDRQPEPVVGGAMYHPNLSDSSDEESDFSDEESDPRAEDSDTMEAERETTGADPTLPIPAAAVARLQEGDFSDFLDTRAGDDCQSTSAIMLAMRKADHREEGGEIYSAAGFCHQNGDRSPQTEPREYGGIQGGDEEPLLSMAGPLATIADIEEDNLDDLDMNGDKRVRPYEAYLNRVYEDDVSKFLYEVIYMYYDVLVKKVVAVVRPLDSAPEAEEQLPILMDGVNGVIELVQAYEARREGEIAVLRPLEDRATMRRLQESDPMVGPVYRLVEAAGGKPIRHKLWRTEETFLFQGEGEEQLLKMVSTTEKNYQLERLSGTQKIQVNTDTTALVVPGEFQAGLIAEYHAKDHMGIRRLYGTMRRTYYWPKMKTDITRYVKRCVRCGLNKAYKGRPKVPIQSYGLPNRPWQRVHWDLTGKLPKTERGMSYILIAKCALTGWVEVFALSDKEALTVAEILVDEIFCRHGAPEELISDRGTEFRNHVMAEISRVLRIRKIHTTAYNPRSDGLVENHMGILKDQIKLFVNKEQDNWDDKLAYFAHVHRTTVNPRTGMTPYFMLYGREARSPDDEYLQKAMKQPAWGVYVRHLVEGLQVCRDIMNIQREVSDVSRNVRSVKPRQFKEYEAGDRFYLSKVPKRLYQRKGTTNRADQLKINAKLQPRFIGPFLILERITPVLYLAQINGKPVRVHAIRMKPYDV